MPTAFTNAQGYHEKSENRVFRRYGKFYSGYIDYSVNNSVHTGTSHKAVTVQGDRKRDLPYGRRVMDITVDQPFHLHEVNPSTSTDLHTTGYLSVSYPTAYMNQPVGWRPEIDNLRSASITKALNKLREGKTQLGADIMEAAKTAHMICDGIKDAFTLFRALKLGNFGYAAKLLAGLGYIPSKRPRGLALPANRWLEYQYGWKPLIGGIYENTETLVKLSKGGFPACVKARSTQKISFAPDISVVGDRNQGWQGSARVRTTLQGSMSNAYLANIDRFGLLNPLSIAWELQPFSFVSDWFMPIGNVLDALSATAGLDFTGGCISERVDGIFTAEMVGGANTIDPGSLRLEQMSFDRTALNEFPMPELYVRANPFSTPHVINAIALISQRI